MSLVRRSASTHARVGAPPRLTTSILPATEGLLPSCQARPAAPVSTATESRSEISNAASQRRGWSGPGRQHGASRVRSPAPDTGDVIPLVRRERLSWTTAEPPARPSRSPLATERYRSPGARARAAGWAMSSSGAPRYSSSHAGNVVKEAATSSEPLARSPPWTPRIAAPTRRRPAPCTSAAWHGPRTGRKSLPHPDGFFSSPGPGRTAC